MESCRILMMSVIQVTKGKVGPGLDLGEMNHHVESHTGNNVTDICNKSLYDWKWMNDAVMVVDLKPAYLQMNVVKKREVSACELLYKGKTLHFTWLGLGPNSVPQVMAVILKTSGRAEKVKAGTNLYNILISWWIIY